MVIHLSWKLFINDYNLEGYGDQHAKLKSLIHWIGLWEDPNAEEPVVIDGIGTQMHVTCYGDATKQAKLQSDIEEMFKLMAKTGKLVKISELDMAYEDEAGTSVTFDKMTEEQHKQMRSFYTFIIQKYFELIPQAQQYGITQWCATDSPKDSKVGVQVALQVFGIATISASTHTQVSLLVLVLQNIGRTLSNYSKRH